MTGRGRMTGALSSISPTRSGTETGVPCALLVLWRRRQSTAGFLLTLAVAACVGSDGETDPLAAPPASGGGGIDPEAEVDAAEPVSPSFPDELDLSGVFQFPVPLVINGVVVDNRVNVQVNASGDIALIEKATLLPFLERLASDPITDAVAGLEDRDGSVTAEQLSAAGLDARFDTASVSFVVDVPLEERTATPLTGRVETPLEPLSGPVVSAVINYFIDQGVTYSSETGNVERDPFNVFTNGAARFGAEYGVTLEAFATYEEDDEVELGDVRAIHDNRDTATRATVGDIFFRTEGFQTTEPLFGVSIERDFNLRPGFVTEPRNAEVFVINRPADISLVVDGVVFREFRLEPGRYSIADLARGAGVTDVEVIIDDGIGPPEVITFSAFSVVDLLGEGIVDFGVNYGYRPDPDNDDSFADFSDGVASGFVRYGVTDSATVGAGIQYDDNGQLYDGEVAVASRLGSLSVSGAYSDVDAETGFAIDSDMTLFPEIVGLPDTLTVQTSVLYQDAGFREFATDTVSVQVTPLGIIEPDTGEDEVVGGDTAPDRLRLDFRIASPVAEGLSADLLINAIDSRSEADSLTVGPGITWRFLDDYTLRLTTDIIFEEDDVSFGGIASLNVPLFGETTGDVLVSFESDNTPTSVQATARRSSAGNRVGAVGYDLSVTGEGNQRGVDGSLNYAGNRFEVDFDGSVDSFEDDVTASGNIEVASAVAFADGHFGIGRPVRDAFAIVYAHPTLDDRVIEVEPSDEGPVARTDALGAAVVPDINAYRTQVLDYAVDDLPLGYDLGSEQFDVNLPFRSGAAFQVGSAGVVSAVGVALLPDGTPVSLLAGTVTSEEVEVPEDAAIFFTNAAGRFAISQLSPGTYTLLLQDGRLRGTFAIPEDTVGLYDVGEVQFVNGS